MSTKLASVHVYSETSTIDDDIRGQGYACARSVNPHANKVFYGATKGLLATVAACCITVHESSLTTYIQ